MTTKKKNPVAKHNYNKPAVHIDKKKESKIVPEFDLDDLWPDTPSPINKKTR